MHLYCQNKEREGGLYRPWEGVWVHMVSRPCVVQSATSVCLCVCLCTYVCARAPALLRNSIHNASNYDSVVPVCLCDLSVLPTSLIQYR